MIEIRYTGGKLTSESLSPKQCDAVVWYLGKTSSQALQTIYLSVKKSAQFDEHEITTAIESYNRGHSAGGFWQFDGFEPVPLPVFNDKP